MLYAAPSPQRKRETSTKENKLRLFLKRSSEPLLNLQNAAQQVRIRRCVLYSSIIDYPAGGLRTYICMYVSMYVCGVCVSVCECVSAGVILHFAVWVCIIGVIFVTTF